PHELRGLLGAHPRLPPRAATAWGPSFDSAVAALRGGRWLVDGHVPDRRLLPRVGRAPASSGAERRALRDHEGALRTQTRTAREVGGDLPRTAGRAVAATTGGRRAGSAGERPGAGAR